MNQSDAPPLAHSGRDSAASGAALREQLQALAEIVSRERDGFDAAGQLPDELY